MVKRGQPSWAALVGIVILIGGALALVSCGGGIAGIDSALKVEDGSVRVVQAEGAESISQYGQTANPQPGYEFIFISVEVKGTVPSAGVTEGVHNLLQGEWALSDAGGARYSAGGLVDGKLVFEVRKPATGLVLWLGDQIQVPLGSFFGEEVAQATPASSASATLAPPVESPTPLPTEPPQPSGPPAGATFKGQFEGGTLEFTIGADGNSIVGCSVNIEGPVPCSDGRTISGVQTQHSFSTPVEGLAFDYSATWVGGITLRGNFESSSAAHGTLELPLLIQGATCTVGPLDWTATSVPTTPSPVQTPTRAGPVMPRAGLWSGPSAPFLVTEDGLIQGLVLSLRFQGTTTCSFHASTDIPIADGRFEYNVEGPAELFGQGFVAATIAGSFPDETTLSGTYSASLCGNQLVSPPAEGEWTATWQGAAPTPTPTETPPPSGLPAGATFTGQFEGGTLEFTIGVDGSSVLGCKVNIEGSVPCSDGGTISGVQAQYDFSTPIDGLAFDYTTSGVGGITFRGSFENETAARGTLEMTLVVQGATCTVGPLEWTATSGEPGGTELPTAPASATPPPAATLPEPAAAFVCPSPRVNDFSSAGGFPTGNESWGKWGVSSGEYYFTMKQANSWGWVSDGVKNEDGIFEADVRQAAEGPGVFGLAFGGNSLAGGQQLYALVIDNQGQYALFRHTQAGEWIEIQPFTYSFILDQGGQTNHLKVVRSGPLIALYANGFPLALTALYDNNLTGSRYAGFVAWSNEAGGLEARFDNYTVCSLVDPQPMPVNPFAEKTVRWPAGQPILLNWAWFATTSELAASFADLSDISLTLDGQPLSGLDEYWGAPSPYASGYGVQWNLPLPPLEAGTHRIEGSLSLSQQISDGFDDNQDGAPDLYGPGPVVSGWVELKVEP